MRILRFAVVVALAAGLAGCGGGTATDGGGDGGGGSTDGGDGGGGTSLPDACTLVTRAEVETAVGGTVAEGAEQDALAHYAFGEGTQCMFIPDDRMVGDTWLWVFRADDESWSDFVSQETEAFGSEPLPGLGDEAIVDFAAIAVRSGEFAMTLQFGMYSPGEPDQQERMVALAQAALSRLPTA